MRLPTLQRAVATSLLLCMAVFSIAAPAALARVYNPNNIIADAELYNPDTLSRASIQNFLEKKNSVLAHFAQTIPDGRTLQASEMIFELAHQYSVNPKFLLTKLEKEQGLIRKSQATEKALDWATGYGCYGGGCNEKYRGFFTQLDAAADTQNIYRIKSGQFAFRIGVPTKTYDGYVVTPQNQATTNLYIYTPYVGYAPELGVTSPYGGNKLFWRVWHRYFSNQKFVDGQVLRSGDAYWLIAGGQKRPYAIKDVFLADHSESDAIVVDPSVLANYPDGPAITVAPHGLVRGAPSGQIYLLLDTTKRPVSNEEVALGLLPQLRIAEAGLADLPSVSDAELNAYPSGDPIASAGTYPQGKLFRETDGTLWLVQNSLRRPVDPLVWQNRFGGKEPEPLSDELRGLPLGSAVFLRDGTFMLSPGGLYYLVSNSERMRIVDSDLFSRVFGTDKQAGALRVSQALLDAHPAGEMIDYIDDTITDTDSAPPVSPSAPTVSYAATFVGLTPQTKLLTGQSQDVSVTFQNTGGAAWEAGAVWLAVKNRVTGGPNFGAPDQIQFAESSVAPNQVATFNFTLTAPSDQAGTYVFDFSLNSATPASPQLVSSAGKFVIVEPSVAGEVTKQTIPAKIKKSRGVVTVSVQIKNTSQDEVWLSRKTALELYAGDGSASPFYDKYDWIRKEVVGVPLNKSKIKPGEIGKFTFTLDPRKVAKGKHTLVFRLNLLDRGKAVLLGDGRDWRQEVTVE